jgi:regulatory protein
MLITKLAQNKKEYLVDIYVDENFAFSLDKTMVVEWNLYKGKMINQEEYLNLQNAGRENKLYNLAVNRILSRPRSVNETRQELLSKGESMDTIEIVVRKLIDNKYLNDKDFAIWWVDNRNTFKAKSKTEIAFELKNKGVDTDLIEEVLNELMDYDQEIENVRKIAEKKYNELKNKGLHDKQLEEKLIVYLQRKGFNWDLINNFLKSTRESI